MSRDPNPFHGWLARELKRKDSAYTTWTALSRASGIPGQTFTRWGSGEFSPSVDMIRRVTRTLDYEGIYKPMFLGLLVTAEILEPEEIEGKGARRVIPDPTLLEDEEIVLEVERRFRERRAARTAMNPAFVPPGHATG